MVEKIKLAIIDNEEGLRAAAVDSAEASLTANKQELKGVKGFFKKIWKHNLAREYYRQKEIVKTKDKIAASGNIYIDEEGTSEDHDEAMSAIIDRFTSDYDEVIDTEAGEKITNLDESLPEEKELKEKITNLVKEYASGSLNEQSFKEQKTRIFAEVATKKKDVLDKSGFYADNLLEIAKQIKENIEHGQKLEDLDLEFEVVIGKAKAGVRTEANYNKVDKLVEKISSTKLGSLVNETTLATGIGVAYSIASALGTKIASNKALAWGTLGASTLLTGGIAGIRENKRLQDERRLHNRQMAQGKNFEPDAKRREEMEEFRYKTESAESLTKMISKIYDEEGSIDKISYQELIETLDSISEIDTRTQLSNKHKIDLISFSEATSVEKERTNLLIENAKTKVELRKLLSNRTDLVLPGNLSFDDYLKKLSDTKVTLFLKGEEGIENKNKLFNKMKAKRVAQTSIKAAGVGLAIGTLFQETTALFNESKQGSIERLFDGKSEGSSTTMVEGIRRWLVGGDSPRLEGPFHEQLINNGFINLPAEASLKIQPDGSYTLARPGEEMFVEHLKIDPQGRLTEESKILLGQHNVLFDEHSNTLITGNSRIEEVITPGQEISQTLPSEEYITKHPELFHEVKRNLWFDNDTKVFDKNELKTWWGGEENTGIDKDGNFVFNVKHMTPGGSYHGNESVDAQGLIKNNNLKMVFSLSRETQNMVCEVPVDQNGNAIISKDSEIGKLLFSTEKGNAKFLGKYAEVVESLGKDDKGVEKIRMLSTVVGDGVKEVNTLETIGSHSDTNIITPEVKTTFVTNLDVPGDDPIDLPLVFPILPRTPLEKISQKPSHLIKNPILLGQGTGIYLPSAPLLLGASSQLLLEAHKQLLLDSKGQPLVATPEGQYLLKYRSKTLTENPEAELDHYKETDAYFKTFSEKNLIEVTELADQVGPLSESIRTTICIPVNCENGVKNLYSSLENYTKQTADSTVYEINLLLHASDTTSKQKPEILDEATKEINRFKTAHPKVNLKIMSKIFSDESLTSGRIRKQLTDATLYRHHQRGPSAKDLIIISNNAENAGIDPDYIQNFITKFDTNEKADGFIGEQDWDPEAYVKYPAIHLGTRLFQYISQEENTDPGKVLPSSSANFSFRASVYSAVGGYIPELTSGEDLILGQEIVTARGNRSALQLGGGKVSRIFTSASSVVETWKQNSLSNKEENEEMGVNFNDKRQLNQLKKAFEHVINRTLDIFENRRKVGKLDESYRRALYRLGVEYALNKKGELVITNMNRLISALKKYQNIGIPLRDYNSGKISKEALEKIIKSNKQDKSVIEL